MDINLPGLSGIQAMTILAEDPITVHIPVIALSANAIPRDIESALKAGFFCYLTKPVKIGEFTDALDEALKFLDTQSASSPRAIRAGSCDLAAANPGGGVEQGSLF